MNCVRQAITFFGCKLLSHKWGIFSAAFNTFTLPYLKTTMNAVFVGL